MIGVHGLLLVCLLQTQPGPESQEKLLPLQDILSSREIHDYKRKPEYRSRVKLFGKAFNRQTKLLQGQIKTLKIDAALETLHSLRSLSDHTLAQKTEREKDLRSNQVKRLEINLRKLLETLEELKRSVPFEYRTHFDQCIEKMEELRNRLLTQLFGQTQRFSAPPPTGVPGPVRALSAFPHPPTSAGLVPSYQSGDRFTDREYVKIQLAQEIARRVGVFLEIAARRLEEIDLKMNPDKSKNIKEEDKKDKKRKKEKHLEQEKLEDSLEFYTYWDMLRAYDRAIEGIMINIDEKAIHKLARPREIRKAMKKLCNKLPEFIPQLEPIQKLALEKQDEDLLAEIKQAQETSSLAQKGCLVGLGKKK